MRWAFFYAYRLIKIVRRHTSHVPDRMHLEVQCKEQARVSFGAPCQKCYTRDVYSKLFSTLISVCPTCSTQNIEQAPLCSVLCSSTFLHLFFFLNVNMQPYYSSVGIIHRCHHRNLKSAPFIMLTIAFEMIHLALQNLAYEL